DAPETQPVSAEDEFDGWPPRSYGPPSAAQAPTPPSYASPRPVTTGPASRAYRRLRRIFPG
ncbi:MAG: hypothetical protein M3Y29_01970, partial [Chloroflexota bacterium]|nr:hypothetical protein [Chloroflexota bacterium]